MDEATESECGNGRHGRKRRKGIQELWANAHEMRKSL